MNAETRAAKAIAEFPSGLTAEEWMAWCPFALGEIERQRVAIELLEIDRDSGNELIRDILKSLCEEQGLSVKSRWQDGPAANYELAQRLGIGRVFGIPNRYSREGINE